MALSVKAFPFAIAAQFLAVAGIIMVLIWCIDFLGGLAWQSTDKSHIFNIHPVLMLIGLVFIGGDAIMVYKSLPFKKQVNKFIHMTLQAIALILGCIGIYAAFKFHNESGIANLYSLHSWIGIVVIVLYGLQWIYGFLIFLFPGVPASVKAISLPWHVIFGLVVYMLAVGNAALGILEKLTFLEHSGLAKYGPEALLANFTAVVAILFGIFVILSVISQPLSPGETETDTDHSYSAI